MTRATVTKHDWDGMPAEQVSAKLERRLITGDSIMLAKVALKADAYLRR